MAENWINAFLKGKTDKENLFYPPASEQSISRTEDALGILFPAEYKAFLLYTNGFEGWIGNFYAQFEAVENIPEQTKICGGEDFPSAIFLGSNRNLEMLVLIKRVKELEFGLLPCIGDENDFISLGTSFQHFIERLFTGTAFDRKE